MSEPTGANLPATPRDTTVDIAKPSAPLAPPAPPMPAPSPQHAQAYPAGLRQSPNGARVIGQKRGPWVVWWLSMITFGIYYFVWYYKINAELQRFAPHAVRVNPALAVVAQFVPIVNLVSIANTAARIKAAHASIGSPVHVSGGVAILSSFWFSSQTRYLQRRLNSLWDTAATLHVHGR